MAEELRDAIMAHLKLRFTVPERMEQPFNALIMEHIKNASQLNRVSMVSITKQFRKDFEKEDWNEIKHIYKGVFVLIMRDYKPQLMWESLEKFLQEYPEFSECSIEEKKLLLEFRNMMVASLQLVDPRNHKGELMSLVGNLCGTVVVTGGGQTAATDRRVLIYERETGILPRKLPERRRKIDKVLLPWTVAANQYIPLPGRSSRTVGPDAKNEIAPADVFALAKKGRFSLPDTKSLLKCADSFWNYHRSLMEANQDIPLQAVAVGSIADVQKFPTHDVFYTPPVTVNPNGTVNTAKLRSFFANLPKIEGVFAPSSDTGGPKVKEVPIPLQLKPVIRDTQEARRLAREAAGHPIRDYNRVSARAASGRTVRKHFGRPVPPPAPIPTPWKGPTKKVTGGEGVTAEGGSGANGASSSSSAAGQTTSESASATASSSSAGTSTIAGTAKGTGDARDEGYNCPTPQGSSCDEAEDDEDASVKSLSDAEEMDVVVEGNGKAPKAGAGSGVGASSSSSAVAAKEGKGTVKLESATA